MQRVISSARAGPGCKLRSRGVVCSRVLRLLKGAAPVEQTVPVFAAQGATQPAARRQPPAPAPRPALMALRQQPVPPPRRRRGAAPPRVARSGGRPSPPGPPDHARRPTTMRCLHDCGRESAVRAARHSMLPHATETRTAAFRAHNRWQAQTAGTVGRGQEGGLGREACVSPCVPTLAGSHSAERRKTWMPARVCGVNAERLPACRERHCCRHAGQRSKGMLAHWTVTLWHPCSVVDACLR
jgi:hypothetical protein